MRSTMSDSLEAPVMQVVGTKPSTPLERIQDLLGFDFKGKTKDYIGLARAVRDYIEDCKKGGIKTCASKVTAMMGRSDGWIYPIMTVLDLPLTVQKMMEPNQDGYRLPIRAVPDLLSMPVEMMEQVASQICAQELNGTEAENYARQEILRKSYVAGRAANHSEEWRQPRLISGQECPRYLNGHRITELPPQPPPEPVVVSDEERTRLVTLSQLPFQALKKVYQDRSLAETRRDVVMATELQRTRKDLREFRQSLDYVLQAKASNPAKVPVARR
jgi:hypothetical protein